MARWWYVDGTSDLLMVSPSVSASKLLLASRINGIAQSCVRVCRPTANRWNLRQSWIYAYRVIDTPSTHIMNYRRAAVCLSVCLFVCPAAYVSVLSRIVLCYPGSREFIVNMSVVSINKQLPSNRRFTDLYFINAGFTAAKPKLSDTQEKCPSAQNWPISSSITPPSFILRLKSTRFTNPSYRSFTCSPLGLPSRTVTFQ